MKPTLRETLREWSFDEWLEDKMQKVYTRDGWPVEQLTLFEPQCMPAPLVGVIPGNMYMHAWAKNGLVNEGEKNDKDLMLVKFDALLEIELFVLDSLNTIKLCNPALPGSYYDGARDYCEGILKFIKKQREENEI